MGRFVVPNEAEVNVLTQVFAVGFTLVFRLFKNAIVIDDATTLADLTEADYSGYTPQEQASIPPVSADSFAGLTNLKGFTGTYSAIFPGSSGADQTVYGAYITYLNADLEFVLMGAANVFDPNPALSLSGKTISGSGDLTALLFNLRLWDFFTGRPALPVGAHFTLWPDNNTYTYSPGTEILLGVADRQGDEMLNNGSTRTATFTSTDPSAVLPPDLDYTSIPAVQTVSVTLVTAGSQSVTATDTKDGSVVGKVSFNIAT